MQLPESQSSCSVIESTSSSLLFCFKSYLVGLNHSSLVLIQATTVQLNPFHSIGEFYSGLRLQSLSSRFGHGLGLSYEYQKPI